jgi:Kae1-associated kinase Bud32
MIWVDNLNATKNPASANKEKPSKDMTINNKNKSNNRARGDCEQKIEPKLFFIDFGLGYTSNKIEDRAVDLHLIKQALEAKHFSIYKEAEKIILENYNSKDKAKVLEQLKKVEARGRYKH